MGQLGYAKNSLKLPAKSPNQKISNKDKNILYLLIFLDQVFPAYVVQNYFLAALAAFPPCPLKKVVGENSPSLCPTISSVTRTSRNLRPL